MHQIYNSLKAEPPQHLILALLFIIYILLDLPTPAIVAPALGTIYAQVLVVVIALIIFVQTTPVIGILAFMAAYFFITRTTHAKQVDLFLPSEKRKIMDFAKYNEYGVTLEEQVVDEMAPIKSTADPADSNFKPVLAGLHDAAPIDYAGVN